MSVPKKEIKRKLRILKHAEYSGNIAKTCRYFGVARSVFYLWRDAYRELGEAGLKRKRPIPKSHPRRTSPEVEEKVLYLRRQYHPGAIRIMWYVERYQYTAIDDATRVRALKIYDRHTQKNAIHFVNHVIEKFPFRIQQIRTDRGHEFQAQFHWHVEDLGIRHVYIKPRHPQLNGKVEWSHRPDQNKIYQLLSYKDDRDLHIKLAEWKQFYNFSRPHGAHLGKTPYEALREKLL